MATYIATVHLLIEADSDAEAADTISGLLTENGKYQPESGILDWSYAANGPCYRHPKQVPIFGDPDDWNAEIWEAIAA